MIIRIRVKSGSSKQDIIKISDNNYVISLKERAEDGKANLELIKLLKRYFKNKCSIKNIKIIKGLKSRDKVVKINGYDVD